MAQMRKGIVKSENKGVCSFLEARPAQKAFLRNSTTRDRQGEVFAAHVFFADGCSLPPPALTLWVKNFLCGKDFKALKRVPRAGVESSALEGFKSLCGSSPWGHGAVLGNGWTRWSQRNFPTSTFQWFCGTTTTSPGWPSTCQSLHRGFQSSQVCSAEKMTSRGLKCSGVGSRGLCIVTHVWGFAHLNYSSAITFHRQNNTHTAFVVLLENTA